MREKPAPESMSLHGFVVFVAGVILLLVGLRYGGR